ncbi:MAG: hypothetical protein V3V22_09875 [Methylococcales bacterium]
MTEYTPIDCGLHSEYELAIIQQRKLRVSWTDPSGQSHIEILQPMDLISRHHEEFMLAETNIHKIIEIRLDYINKTYIF